VPTLYAKRLKSDMQNCKFATETSSFENIETIQDLFTQIG
jgi:hypothetical protein